MPSRNQINSNFWQIANTDANGTITGITVAAANLGYVGNVEIQGGLNGQFLQTDGTGNLTWANSAAVAIAAGTNTQVQFNNSAVFGASANFTFDRTTDTLTVAGNVVTGQFSGGGLTVTGNIAAARLAVTGNISGANLAVTTANLGTVANVRVLGGLNGQYLQTDGSGNLSWANVATANAGNGLPGGANTQIQFNDSGFFGGSGNLVFNKDTQQLTVTGNTQTTNLTVTADSQITGNITANNAQITANITAGNVIATAITANTSVSAASATVTANITAGNVSAQTFTGNLAGNVLGNTITANNITAQRIANLGSIANVIITGGFPGQFITTDGAGGLSWGQATASGAVTNLSYSTEVVTLISPPVTTYNYDVSVSSVKYAQLASAGSITINFRGSTTQTLTGLVPTGTSATVTYVMTTGALAYGVVGVSIDGVEQVIRWSGGAAPIPQSSSLLSYTFTLIKTSATPNWTVLGALTRYA